MIVIKVLLLLQVAGQVAGRCALSVLILQMYSRLCVQRPVIERVQRPWQAFPSHSGGNTW